MTEDEKPEQVNQPGEKEEKGSAAPGHDAAGSEDHEPADKHSRHKGKKDSRTAKAEEELEKLNDKYLRLYSEFDNYRRRTLKEKIDLSKTASAEVITSLLPVIDDFERAISALSNVKKEGDNPLLDGVVLIYSKLLNILTQQGLEQMKTIGEPFNTDLHEAITNIPAPDPEQKGKVIDEVTKGYVLNGKVIRFAKVVVGA
jgi:molecular chaperone GrpE